MADGSSLFVPVTLILLYGLMFLAAGISLVTTIRHLQAGRRRLRWRRWWRREVAPEPGVSSEGQPEQQRHQCCPEESAKIPLPPGHEAPKETECPTVSAALPGRATAALLKDASSQTDTSGGPVADIKAVRSQPRNAAPAIISKLRLSQVARRKLSMHTARKCLEVKLQLFPVAVRRSTELLRHPQPPRRAPVFILKRRCPLHPDRARQPQHGAPPACPTATSAPASQPVPIYFYSNEAKFLPEEELEALELHIRSMKLQHLGNRLVSDSPLQPAVPGEDSSTSTYVTAPSEPAGAEAGPKGHKGWPQCKKRPSRGKSTWSTKAECCSFPSARVRFCGVQENTTTYCSSSLQPRSDPVSGSQKWCRSHCARDAAAIPTAKKAHVVWAKMFPMPQMPRISVSKCIHLACKERKGQAQ